MVNPRRPEILRNNRALFRSKSASYQCSLTNLSSNPKVFADKIKMYAEVIQDLEKQITEINEELGDE